MQFSFKQDDHTSPLALNNGASCVDSNERYSSNCTAGFSAFYCETAENKINEMEYCDRTHNVHASSLHESPIFIIIIVINLDAKGITGKKI